jgi:hypothetical protein
MLLPMLLPMSLIAVCCEQPKFSRVLDRLAVLPCNAYPGYETAKSLRRYSCNSPAETIVGLAGFKRWRRWPILDPSLHLDQDFSYSQTTKN